MVCNLEGQDQLRKTELLVSDRVKAILAQVMSFWHYLDETKLALIFPVLDMQQFKVISSWAHLATYYQSLEASLHQNEWLKDHP